jgi:hypothetical protein
MMDSQHVHHTTRAGQAGVGVGVEPGGFTPLGGGGASIPRLAKWLRETFCEVIKNEMGTKSSGQSFTETVLLTAFISLGAGATLAVCHERVARFIELIISMIACPAP